MNKKLLALAVGAVAALPAAVLAAGPTLYGQIDVSLQKDRVEDHSSSTYSDPNGWYLQNNASRLGVRGEADTSVSGLKGIYQAEYGVDATDSNVTGVFTQRDIFVGLQSDSVGTLKLGTMDTVLKTAQGTVDQFNDSVLDMDAVIPGENRDHNMIKYMSPAFLDKALTVSASHEPSGDNANKPYELGVTYDKDGLFLSAAYDKRIVNGSGGLQMGMAGTDYTGGGNDVQSGQEMDATRVVAQYSTDSFNVGGLYQQSKDNYTSPTVTYKDTSFLVGGAFIMDAWKFKAQYVQTKGDNANMTIKGYGVGADYAVGKTTTVYALAGNYATSTDPKAVANTFGIGVRQKF